MHTLITNNESRYHYEQYYSSTIFFVPNKEPLFMTQILRRKTHPCRTMPMSYTTHDTKISFTPHRLSNQGILPWILNSSANTIAHYVLLYECLSYILCSTLETGVIEISIAAFNKTALARQVFVPGYR